jgi:group I intron endonuclease
MNTSDLQHLHQIGVYSIFNKINKKVYIGSTTMSFLKRFQHHISVLKINKHKNKHLQNAWNKYGEDNFQFDILQICEKDQCLIREQYYIDIHKEYSYNINPVASGTPNLSKETIEKRRNTMLLKYKNGEIKSNFYKGFSPWNKGIKIQNTDYLKVPKTKTEKLILEAKRKSIIYRENAPKIDVYSLENIYLGTWNSSIDLQENSLKDDFILKPYVKSRFKAKYRRSKPYYYLATNHINSCANNNLSSYKGLIFKFNTAPLHSNM